MHGFQTGNCFPFEPNEMYQLKVVVSNNVGAFQILILTKYFLAINKKRHGFSGEGVNDFVTTVT